MASLVLPFDVLSNIVILCAREPETPILKALKALWPINKAWHHAVFTSPLAWSVIELAPPQFCHIDGESVKTVASWRDHRGGLTTVRQLKEFLRRSTTVLKDVFIKHPGLCEADQDSCFRLLKEHLPYIRRLEYFNVPGWNTLHRNELFIGAAQELPELRRLALHLQSWADFDDTFPAATNLSHLVLYNPLILTIPERARRTLKHLTVYSRVQTTTAWLHRTLQPETFPALRSLSLTTSFNGVHEDMRLLHDLARLESNADLDVLVNDQLTALSMVIRAHFRGVLTEFKCPALTQLALASTPRIILPGTIVPEVEPCGAIVTIFLSAPYTPPLRTLHLHTIVTKDEHTLATLRLLPLLEVLALSHMKMTDTVVKALSAPGEADGSWLCPQLTHFSYYTEVRTDSDAAGVVTPGAVEELVKARGMIDGGSALQRSQTEDGPVPLHDVRLHGCQMLGFQGDVPVWSQKDTYFSALPFSSFDVYIQGERGWWDFPLFTDMLD